MSVLRRFTVTHGRVNTGIFTVYSRLLHEHNFYILWLKIKSHKFTHVADFTVVHPAVDETFFLG